MAITSYCKKCGRDVPVGDICENCGAKLLKSSARVAWCVEHAPVKDWISWNSAMRILLPLLVVVLGMILVLEGIAGGTEAVEALLRNGLVISLLGLLMMVTVVLLLVLILQGDDWLDCIVDSKGVHVSCYLPYPTPLKLMMRLRSPAQMQQVDLEDEIPMVLISQQDLSWKDIARVQLWPEKNLILFYAPVWWMRLALPCTPFTYEDSMDFIREKLGRKKTVALPAELVAPPKPKEPKHAKAKEPKAEQLSFADVPSPAEETMPPAPAEQEGGFVSLEDVLGEIKAAEQAETAEKTE